MQHFSRDTEDARHTRLSVSRTPHTISSPDTRVFGKHSHAASDLSSHLRTAGLLRQLDWTGDYLTQVDLLRSCRTGYQDDEPVSSDLLRSLLDTHKVR